MEEQKNKVKIPPNSKESEMMVLGCMLTSINALNVGADSLDDGDFYYTEHKIIFHSLKAAYKSDKPADLHLISEELKRQGKLESAGGIAYLTVLAQYAGTSAHIEEYCRLVKDKAVLRRMIFAAQEVEKVALEEPSDVSEALDGAQQLFYQIGQAANDRPGVLIGEILSGVKAESQQPFLKALQEKQERYQLYGPEEAGIAGIRTHFADMDKILNGFAKSNLMILAARPAMGKTALALNIAENICTKNRIPVGIFSLEMSAEQLVHRIVCSRAEVESDKIKTGALNGLEYQRIVAAVGELEEFVMVIDDQPGLKVTDLRARARRMRESYNIGFLMIDYLQLISGSGSHRSNENRQIEISEISRMLKNLARELDIPILCLSQLSRKVEERQGHRPMMSDLRESGSIEQDADIVMFLLRREYYDPNDKPGQAELIIGKNRHGPVGSVHFAYRKEFAQFANYAPLKFQSKEADLETERAYAQFSPGG
jgi:replicative DNA helicase